MGDPNYIEVGGLQAVDDPQIDWDELHHLIVDELRSRGYKFCGFYHQDGDYGAPVIDGKYTVLYSYRGWGGVMAEAYQLDNSDGMAYCEWAWSAPEEQVFPNPSDYN